MLCSSIILLLLVTIGNAASLPRRDDEPSDVVKRALEEAGVDIDLKVAKPKNVNNAFTKPITQLDFPDFMGYRNY